MGQLLYLIIAKIVIYEQARVKGGSNYKYPWLRWVLKLVSMKYSGWEESEDCPNLQDRQENGSKGKFIYLIDCLICTLL